MLGNKNGSQSSEIDVPLPVHAAAAVGYEPRHSELEMGILQNAQRTVATKNFEASDHAVYERGRKVEGAKSIS